MSVLSHLEPKIIWNYFDAITRIPRPSKKEDRIRQYLIGFARQRGLDFQQDATGNVVIRKPASPGMEDRPGVTLQSHMDMVCEKNTDVGFDFDNDPIRVAIDNGWVRAQGTTLGADDGIGMAAALAVLASDTVSVGPIEALFTVDEETGLTGAFNLGSDMITAHYLINLDSEDEGEIFIGCAGGIDTVATFHDTPNPAPDDYVWFRADISGLRGGHSGDNIDDGLANSNKLMTRVLWYGERDFGLRLSCFDGGNLRNAIPREAFAVFGVPAGTAVDFGDFFQKIAAEMADEFRHTEPNLRAVLTETSKPETVLDLATQHNVLNALQGVPNGVLAMSRTMENLVETSTNLASVKFEGDSIVVTTSQRSSVESAKSDAASTVESVFRLGGADVTHSDGYPGWTPDPSSRLLDVAKKAYHGLFGREPRIRAIHAGLECGLFLQKYPHLEMISIGPTLRGVHSPDERLDIQTVDKFWKLLLETLRNI